MVLRYCSGQEVMKGDKVLFHGNPAEIELVASDQDSDDPEVRSFIQEYGGGVMVLDPMVSGRTFIDASQVSTSEDLEFVRRATES